MQANVRCTNSKKKPSHCNVNANQRSIASILQLLLNSLYLAQARNAHIAIATGKAIENVELVVCKDCSCCRKLQKAVVEHEDVINCRGRNDGQRVDHGAHGQLPAGTVDAQLQLHLGRPRLMALQRQCHRKSMSPSTLQQTHQPSGSLAWSKRNMRSCDAHRHPPERSSRILFGQHSYLLRHPQSTGQSRSRFRTHSPSIW